MIKAIKTVVSGRSIRSAATQAEGWWFDATRCVQTSGYTTLNDLTLAGTAKSGFDYLPIRPSVARRALRRLPIKNFEEYTFIDLGSGKGRMLLVAAEYPFRRIQGVEFAIELHYQAQENIALYSSKRRCTPIESINLDAADYVFPEENLVLYLFNPFGPEVIQKVFRNLAASFAQCPRHIVVLTVNIDEIGPENPSATESPLRLQLNCRNRRFKIYCSA